MGARSSDLSIYLEGNWPRPNEPLRKIKENFKAIKICQEAREGPERGRLKINFARSNKRKSPQNASASFMSRNSGKPLNFLRDVIKDAREFAWWETEEEEEVVVEENQKEIWMDAWREGRKRPTISQKSPACVCVEKRPCRQQQNSPPRLYSNLELEGERIALRTDEEEGARYARDSASQSGRDLNSCSRVVILGIGVKGVGNWLFILLGSRVLRANYPLFSLPLRLVTHTTK